MDRNEVSDLIYDVGAHKGEDSDFYLRLGFRVVAVEANPTLVDKLKQRFRGEISIGKYILVEKAINKADGVISFFVNKEVSAWGTADPDWAMRNKGFGAESDELKVESIRFAEILQKFGCPYYLKIDIEGADMLCVNALKDVDCRPKYISIESSKTSWSELLNELNTLESLGYFKFKIVGQGKHKSGSFHNMKGEVINYNFENEATGPFGKDLSGRWLTKKEAIWKYVWIFMLYKTLGDNTFIKKAMDRIPILRYISNRVSWYDTHGMRD